ncbi:MAG: TonB-dependent receptor [Methylophilaceae bacterium]
MKPITKRLSLIGLLLTNPAFAADDLKVKVSDVIVSADFRPSTAAETPISLTEIDEETIESRGAQHLEEVLNLAPNVNVSSGASRGQYYQIRGIGERSQFNAPLNPSVGLVIDGIDFSRTGGAATLFDIDSIEVLRGPQGTKFGTNALAGTINMRSKEPTKDFEMHAETGFAEYNTRNFGIAAGGTIVEDQLLGRASLYSHKSDGYMDNDFLGRDNTQNQDELTFRSKFKLFATEDLTFDFTYMHLDIDNGYDAFTLDNSRNSQANNPGEDKQRTNAVGVKANWQASDAVIIQSEATYLNSDIVYSYDADWIADDFAERFDRERDNYSFELRALSDKAGRIFADTTDWTIGLFHLNQDEQFLYTSDFIAAPLGGDYDTKNTAIYGQLDMHFTDKLTFVTGARVEYFEADYDDSSALKLGTNETLFGGKLGVNYQANKNHLLYTTLSRGYKSGGVNNNRTIPTNLRVFDTEYNITLEAGVKSSWMNERLNTTLAVFYTDRRNAQTNNSFEIPKVGGGSDFQIYIGNESDAIHKGVEATIDWFVTDKFRLLGSLGLLDAKFDKRLVGDNFTGQVNDYSGRQVAHAPDYTYSLGAEFYPTTAWTIRANVEGKDKFYFSDSHNQQSTRYDIVNASADYRHNKNWKVSIWARNLFDKDYTTRGFFFANNPANGYTVQEKYTQFGEPRVAGMTVTYDY